MGCSPPGSSVHGFLWSGLPFPSPGELPDPGIEPGFPALQADCLPSEPAGKPTVLWRQVELGIGGEQEPLTALREPTFWGEDREWVWQWQEGRSTGRLKARGRGARASQASSDSPDRGWKEEPEPWRECLSGQCFLCFQVRGSARQLGTEVGPQDSAQTGCEGGDIAVGRGMPWGCGVRRLGGSRANKEPFTLRRLRFNLRAVGGIGQVYAELEWE